MVRNVPQSLSVSGSGRGGPASSLSHGDGASINMDSQMQVAEQLVLDLRYPVRRERALLELSKKRELFHDLAPLLSNSFASIPSYLYAFLVTTSKSRPFEYLRLASLGVIGALVKAGDTEVIRALLSPEIIPSCLRSMDIGCELSKTVATFILQKILLDDAGLDYICTRAVRFFDVAQALGNMVGELVEQPSSRLMKYIIRCYLRLSDNPRACDALGSCLPDMLRDTTFSSCLRGSSDEDVAARIASKVDGNLDALQAGGSASRIHSTRITFQGVFFSLPTLYFRIQLNVFSQELLDNGRFRRGSSDEDVAARTASKGRWESGWSAGWRIGPHLGIMLPTKDFGFPSVVRYPHWSSTNPDSRRVGPHLGTMLPTKDFGFPSVVWWSSVVVFSWSRGVRASAKKDRKMQSAKQLVLELNNLDLHENALLELSNVYSSHFDGLLSCFVCTFVSVYYSRVELLLYSPKIKMKNDVDDLLPPLLFLFQKMGTFSRFETFVVEPWRLE
ncbi:hypothetical protein BC332_24877 [Capsicum chinense]|nr:hypothetical protein BC332_24877 [Capsicum chinense]